MSKTAALDQLQQVQELNRAFLGLLQMRVLELRPSLGLPAPAHSALASAGASVLEAAASFPRALFQVRIVAGARLESAAVGAMAHEAEHDLWFSILYAARQASRQSPYQARLLFGLAGGDIEQFCSSPFAALQQLACVPGVVQCAFGDRHWFWQLLFTTTRPELRRQLTLIALQPHVAVAWPQRRPAQPAA